MGKEKYMKKHIDVLWSYSTKYSIEDCIAILERKNIYDVFEYSFERKTYNTAELVVIKCNTHLCRNIRTVYKIEFIEDKHTILLGRFINESYVFSRPFIFQEWMDEFMKKKLDATPIELEKH